MKFNLDHSAGIRIHGYDDAEVTLALPGTVSVPDSAIKVPDTADLYRFSQNLVISSQVLDLENIPASPDELEDWHLEKILAYQPEVILLGTGVSLRFPAAHLMAIPAQRGVGMEVMDAPAACRTFNILAAEDRRVFAMLFMAC